MSYIREKILLMTEMGRWPEKILRGFVFLICVILDLVLFDFVLLKNILIKLHEVKICKLIFP